jgi:hypothetical protein
MAPTIMCRLPHRSDGRFEERAILGLWESYRVPNVRGGFKSESVRNLLDNLSAEAIGAGVCPNHVRVLCRIVAYAIAAHG